MAAGVFQMLEMRLLEPPLCKDSLSMEELAALVELQLCACKAAHAGTGEQVSGSTRKPKDMCATQP